MSACNEQPEPRTLEAVSEHSIAVTHAHRFDLRQRAPVSCSVGVRYAKGLGSTSVAENTPAVDA